MERGLDAWTLAVAGAAEIDSDGASGEAMEEVDPFGFDAWVESSDSSESVQDEVVWSDVGTAAPARGPPAAPGPVASPPVQLPGAPGAKRQRRQTAAGSPAAVDPTCWAGLTLSHESVYAWLEDAAVTCCGPRPPFLRGIQDVEGRIYKEHVSTRRAQGTDLWTVKGGPKGCSIKEVGANVWVKRAYGTQLSQQLCL